VYGATETGSICEFAVADSGKIALKPKNMSFEESASLPIAAVTSLQSLKHANVKPGSDVLVIGASGGTGYLGVEIAKAMGARVTGICGTHNVEFVKSLGADSVIDYHDTEALDALNDGDFDVVYDTVTSPDDPNYGVLLKSALKPGGKWEALNGHPADWVRKFLPLVPQRANYNLITTQMNRKDLEEVVGMAESGKIRAVVAGEFKLEEGSVWEAFEKLKSRRTRGKMVIVCSEEEKK